MENVCNILKLLFKEVSAKDILEGRIHYNNFEKKPFTDLALAHYQRYSGNDAENLYYYLCEEVRQEQNDPVPGQQRNHVNVFEVLSKFDNLILKEIQEIPVCRYRYLLKWRMVSFALEEELFTTSFLAQRDCFRHRILRTDFAWKYIINSDNVELNNILNRGLADNHFHLKGSAPYFYMSWINLMNRVDDKKFIQILHKYDDNRQQEFSVYHTRAAEESLVVMHLQAALIRIYLYAWITRKPFYILEHNFARFDLIKDMIEWEEFDNTVDIAEELRQKMREERSRSPYGMCRADRVLWQYWLGKSPSSGKRSKFTWICDNLLHHIDINELIPACGNLTERQLVYGCFQQRSMVDWSREFLQLFVRQDKREGLTARIALEEVQRMLQNQNLLLLNRDRLQDMINNLKTEGRTPYEGMPLDYMQEVQEVQEEGLYGERWFLYRMFRKLYEGDREAKKRGNLFYAYLVIKERIRAELIQVNDRVGFENFLRYQNRKEEFIDGTVLSRVYSRHAVVSSFNGQPLQILEARITPRKTAKENCAYIRKIDREILCSTKKADCKFINGQPLEKRDFFYVFHFVKEPDMEKEIDSYRCRHFKLRNKIRKQAVAIYNFREQYAEEASRVYGIDACSPEIGCRPEVFAQVFRYLKGEQNFVNGVNPEKRRPRLRSTFHVGEDFLDIVDGMRAIDEAIYFLNMTHGDRLGHALALGVSPREWYRFKENRVLCTKQDVLDNIVWVHQKIRKYDIRGTESILMKLQRRFVHLYQQIYRGPASNGKDCDIDLYYDAWKLRGDDPALYYTMQGDAPTQTLSALDMYAKNIKYPELDKIRREKRCAELYHRYHYDAEVKRNGQIVIEYKVEQDVIKVVEKIQYHLQREILEKGLAIEVNPSSNYLIGTFRAYDKHPIISWYNKGLTNDKEELDRCPQLDVTINTDDQAVFGTSLENEFALMAVALEKAIDNEGNLKYKKDMIYDWLDDIRKKGFTRCFRQVRGETRIEDGDLER